MLTSLNEFRRQNPSTYFGFGVTGGSEAAATED
jgi:hypothetical protein